MTITNSYLNIVRHTDGMDVSPEVKVAIHTLNALSQMAHQTATEKGFYEFDRNQGEIIALVHSELSEALEALRQGNPPDKHLPEFTSIEVEYADAVIRIFDTCAANGYRLGAAIIAKMEYNQSRPPRNGKLF